MIIGLEEVMTDEEWTWLFTVELEERERERIKEPRNKLITIEMVINSTNFLFRFSEKDNGHESSVVVVDRNNGQWGWAASEWHRFTNIGRWYASEGVQKGVAARDPVGVSAATKLAEPAQGR